MSELSDRPATTSELIKMIDKLERYLNDVTQQRNDALNTVKHVWESLGIKTYAEAHDKTIWELVADLEALTRQLREALRTYGRHLPDCEYLNEQRRLRLHVAKLPCTCGLTEVGEG